jgi:RNA polymerase sigma-70 factor, ECF subfamily
MKIKYNPCQSLDPKRAMSYNELSHPDLVNACLKNDQAAWKEFVFRYHQVISVTVLRTARRWGDSSKAVVDDLIGDTYLKLCADDFALLRHFEFRTDAGIYGYLKVVAANVVHDYFRQRHAKKRGVEVTIEDVYATADPPNPGGADEIERSVLMKEVEEALFEVTGPEGERDRTIFWLYYRQGFPANAIAELGSIGLTTKGIESAIHRLTKAVRERLTNRTAACIAAEPEKGVP